MKIKSRFFPPAFFAVQNREMWRSPFFNHREIDFFSCSHNSPVKKDVHTLIYLTWEYFYVHLFPRRLLLGFLPISGKFFSLPKKKQFNAWTRNSQEDLSRIFEIGIAVGFAIWSGAIMFSRCLPVDNFMTWHHYPKNGPVHPNVDLPMMKERPLLKST